MQPLPVGQGACLQTAIGRAIGILRSEIEQPGALARADGLRITNDLAERIARKRLHVAAPVDACQHGAGIRQAFGAVSARPLDGPPLRIEAQRLGKNFPGLSSLALDDLVLCVEIVENAFFRRKLAHRTAEIVAPEHMCAAAGIAQCRAAPTRE